MRTHFRCAAGAALLISALSRAGRADGVYWSLRYGPSVPVGSVRDFISSATPLGAGMDWRYWLAGTWSIGIDGAWTRLYETSDHGTYPMPAGALTATIYRYAEVVAIMPEAHFYLNPHGNVVPYLGLAAGPSWVRFRVLVSDIDVSETDFGLMVSPQAGILVPFDRGETIFQALLIGARYNTTTAGYGASSSTSFVALEVGALVY